MLLSIFSQIGCVRHLWHVLSRIWGLLSSNFRQIGVLGITLVSPSGVPLLEYSSPGIVGLIGIPKAFLSKRFITLSVDTSKECKGAFGT